MRMMSYSAQIDEQNVKEYENYVVIKNVVKQKFLVALKSPTTTSFIPVYNLQSRYSKMITKGIIFSPQ